MAYSFNGSLYSSKNEWTISGHTHMDEAVGQNREQDRQAAKQSLQDDPHM